VAGPLVGRTTFGGGDVRAEHGFRASRVLMGNRDLASPLWIQKRFATANAADMRVNSSAAREQEAVYGCLEESMAVVELRALQWSAEESAERCTVLTYAPASRVDGQNGCLGVFSGCKPGSVSPVLNTTVQKWSHDRQNSTTHSLGKCK
jgi:hypothetical protein